MGCSCDILKKDNNSEMTNDLLQRVDQISKDESKMDSVIKIQRNFRTKLIRLKLKSLQGQNKNINSSYHAEPTYNSSSRLHLDENIYDDSNKIKKEELDILFQKYPPLNDGINVKILTAPIKEKATNSIYFGEFDFSKKVKHGRGIQLWEEGSKYTGYFTDNKANIKGRLLHNDGDIYEGSWADNKPNGKGKYTHIDGTIYEGDWVDDKQHGKGKEVWPDGSSYEGDYINGQKHGKGKFIWADGSVYEGEFSHNNINGEGYYVFGDKRTYKGTWENNKLQGKGIFTWPDGRRYEGEYKNDKKDGFGCFYWSDGKIYKGFWKNGKQNGT